jgi:hypothetical protein
MIMNSTDVRTFFLNVGYSIKIDRKIFSGLSVKERARMLTTTNPPLTSNDKKTTTSPPNTTGK